MLVLTRKRDQKIIVHPNRSLGPTIAGLMMDRGLPVEDAGKWGSLLQDIFDSEVFNFEIVLIDIRGDKVRVGIAADECWEINREEIEEAIRQEMEEARVQKAAG